MNFEPVCAPLALLRPMLEASLASGPDWAALALGIIGGLVIFLVGVEHLSSAFGAIGDERLQRWVDRFTTSVYTGVLTGTIVCTLLDSSSATIIMVIAMIRGGLLTFKQSLGVVMGANIGTTIGAQVIALDVFGYAPVILLVGFVMQIAFRPSWQKTVGTGLLGAGLVFFGLGHLEGSVLPLRDYAPFLRWVEGLADAPLLGAFAGALVTLVIQSSSATVGMSIVMAKAELISVPAGVAIMLGAEIETVSNTILASLGRGRDALRCAVFHLFFNLTTVIAGLFLIGPLILAAEALAGGAADEASRTAHAIANAQVIFNVVGVLVFLPIIGPISRLLLRWGAEPAALTQEAALSTVRGNDPR